MKVKWHRFPSAGFFYSEIWEPYSHPPHTHTHTSLGCIVEHKLAFFPFKIQVILLLPAPWESGPKSLFAAVVFSWGGHPVSQPLFQTPCDRLGLTPASWRDRCCAGAHLYLSRIIYTWLQSTQLPSTLSICSLLEPRSPIFSEKQSYLCISFHYFNQKSHKGSATNTVLLKQTKKNPIITQRDSSSRSPKNWIISDIFCIYLTAPVLPHCVFVCGFSRLQPQCLGRDWFKYHPISLTCTDRAARANYIHLVMWLGFQVVNILWQHAPPAAAAATHQCSYIIPQLRIRNIPLNTHSSRSWQYKHEKWAEGETAGNPHI